MYLNYIEAARCGAVRALRRRRRVPTGSRTYLPTCSQKPYSASKPIHRNTYLHFEATYSTNHNTIIGSRPTTGSRVLLPTYNASVPTERQINLR